MTTTEERIDAPSGAGRASPNGRDWPSSRTRLMADGLALWSRYGPYILSSILLLLGYLHYAPGAAYSLSAERYRAWAFPAFRYSDLIWLYLRDGLDRHPIPYVDFPLEYPPLTGLLTWALSWAPDLPTYFALAYGVLAMSALLAVWALQQIAGANVWLFAASPALFFYTGHQWDMAAIGVAALGLLALQRRQDGLGMVALVVATALKLFPVVFVVAAIVESLRDRRFRTAAKHSLIFAAGTAAINVPVALANVDGWSFFFRWNRDRLADSEFWVLWRGIPTADLTRWSLVAAVAGGLALTFLAFRTRGPLLVPLGATYLLWWLLVNKTFTTHLMLWAILSLALLSAPWWLWLLTTAADVVGFQLGNYLNLYNVPDYESAPLIRKAVENIYDPMQLTRSAILLFCSHWGIHILRLDRLRVRYTASPPLRSVPNQPVAATATALVSTAPLPAARRLFWAATLTFAFAAAAVFMSWPYAQHLSDATVVGFDPFLQIWLSEWIQHILVTNPLHLYDANIFYPFAQTLAYTDANIPGALVAAPLRWLTGDPILTNSILVLASFVLAAGGVYALVVSLTGNRGAAFVAGLAYAFLPYRMIHLWHLNWLEGALLPWLILAFLRLLDHPSKRRGVALGLIAAVLVLVSFYFSVQIALTCGIVVAGKSVAQRRLPSRAFAGAAAVALAIAAAVAVPLYLPYLNVRDEQGLERTIVDAEQYKALPASYLQLAPWDAPNPVQLLLGLRAGPNESLTEVGQAPYADGHQHAEIVIEDALFPGIIALIFAAVALFAERKRRWVVAAFATVALAAAILSLGPSLGPRQGAGPPLPYGWLFEHVPLFRSMRVPARLGGLTDLMVVVLAGMGMAVAWDKSRASARFARYTQRPVVGPLATGLLTAAVLAELWTGAAPIEAVDRSTEASAAAQWLATQPPGPLMEFPAESVFADPAAASVRRHYGETMFWSTLNWDPLVNGNSGFIPRAYSDFIERFVGDLKRPDGSLTPRISHVDEQTVRLLSQIGVRYLVFQRSHYRPEDWPAVAAELATLVEQGAIAPAGDHGEATLFVVNPALPGVEPPEVTLFAPTLITPDLTWTPWVAVEGRSSMPAVLSLTQPPVLETAWYDNAGKLLWQGTQRIPLPVVLDEPRLLCSPADCLTSRPFDDLSQLPPPESEGSWNPHDPGHYVVRLRLSGDHPLECAIDLDLVENSTEVLKRAGNVGYRWAECRSDSENPVNNPGAMPFLLSPPSVTLVNDTAVIDIAVTPRRDGELQGWFILAPPGAAEPWLEAVYQSAVQQKLVTASQPMGFAWTASIGSKLSPGIYELTVWFHDRGPAGWEHAAGGDIDLAPVIVDADHQLRWAGPIRVQLAQRPSRLVPGQTSQFEFTVSGLSNGTDCFSRWQLYSAVQLVASGGAGTCASPEVEIPPTLTPGSYRLQIDVLADADGTATLDDAVSLSVMVTETAAGGQPR
jgi:hypothetical protein